LTTFRINDGNMFLVDLVLVKENGLLRKYHFYATKEQRVAYNELFAAVRDGLHEDK